MLNSLTYIHGVTAKTVKLGDDQHVCCLHWLQQLLEDGALLGGNTTRYSFLDHSA
ncbi:hypothetical protein D3C73_1533660 [compost metagenome]